MLQCCRYRLLLGALLLMSVLLAVTDGSTQIGEPTSPDAVHSASKTRAALRLTSIGSLSSSADVRRQHPLLDRAVDIVAGPADPEPRDQVLQRPTGVATDSKHRVFVTDAGARTVHVFDFAAQKYFRLEPEKSRLGAPSAIAIDNEDNVYVADAQRGWIVVYDSHGKFRRYLGRFKDNESYFQSPTSIAVDRTTGHLYVSDTTRDMIVVLDPKGKVLARFGRRGGGSAPGEFMRPTALAISGDRVIVLDALNSRLQILDLQGHFRDEIKVSLGANNWGWDHSSGLGADNDGNIYLSDGALGILRVLDRAGNSLYVVGRGGKDDASLWSPSGISVGAERCVYVVDPANHRVQMFQVKVDNNRDTYR